MESVLQIALWILVPIFVVMIFMGRRHSSSFLCEIFSTVTFLLFLVLVAQLALYPNTRWQYIMRGLAALWLACTTVSYGRRCLRLARRGETGY